jgi:hypothetical protein
MTKENVTSASSHRATQRGYAGGDIIEPGDLVPAGTPVSTEWMEPLSKKEGALARAMDEALSPNDADVNVEELSGDALTAYAAGLSINRAKLNDKDLRAAVTAKRADTA